MRLRALSWAAGRRGAGAGGTGNQLDWAERETSPHPRAGARRGHLGGAGLAGFGLARLLLHPACSTFRHPGCGLRALVPSGFPAAWEAFAASGVTNGHCSRSSRYFLGQGAPPFFGNATCQPPYSHLYSPSSVSRTTSLFYSQDSKMRGAVKLSLSMCLGIALRCI